MSLFPVWTGNRLEPGKAGGVTTVRRSAVVKLWKCSDPHYEVTPELLRRLGLAGVRSRFLILVLACLLLW